MLNDGPPTPEPVRSERPPVRIATTTPFRKGVVPPRGRPQPVAEGPGDDMLESVLLPSLPPEPMTQPLFRDLDMEGTSLRQLDLDHPDVEARILGEMASGVKVYYDRAWPFTRQFCRFLLRRSELFARRRILVVGAGLGLESVVAGREAERLWINDMAPVALELQQLQLRENGVLGVEVLPGSFGNLELPTAVNLVMGCFVIYDHETAKAMKALLRQAHRRGITTLLADMDIGGHFSLILDGCQGPVRPVFSGDDLLPGEPPIRVVQIG